MDKKSKIFLFCLGAVSLFAVGLAVWIYISSQGEVTRYIRRHAELQRENTGLQEKLAASQDQARHWQDKSQSITAALNRLGKEHTLLQKQYDPLSKEKQLLTRQNKALSEQLKELDKLYSMEKERVKLDTSDEFLASLLEEKAQIEVELEKLKTRLSSYETEVEQMQGEAEPFKEKIAQLEKEKAALESALTDARKVSDVLSNDLLKERKEKDSLEKDLSRLSAQLQEMEQTTEQGQVEDLSIELPPIVVRAEEDTSFPLRKLSPQEVAEGRPVGLTGRIITVNAKHRFVVINLGRESGVQDGMTFDVYRDGEKIGRVQVIETRKNISACDIREISTGRLKVEDTVRR